MLSGKSKSGFEFAVNPDVLDDWDLIDLLTRVETDTSAIIKAAEMLLGTEQLDALKSFMRSRDGAGRLRFSAMVEELNDIMEKIPTLKN